MNGSSFYGLHQLLRQIHLDLQYISSEEMDILRELTNSFKNIFLESKPTSIDIELYEPNMKKPSEALVEHCFKLTYSQDEAVQLANRLQQALFDTAYWKRIEKKEPVPDFSLIKEKIEAIFANNAARKQAILCLLDEEISNH